MSRRRLAPFLSASPPGCFGPVLALVLGGVLALVSPGAAQPAGDPEPHPLPQSSRVGLGWLVPSIGLQLGGGTAYGGLGGQFGLGWSTGSALEVGPFAAVGYRPREDLAPPVYPAAVGAQLRYGRRHRALVQLGYGGLRTRKRRLHGEAFARAFFMGGFAQLGYEYLWGSGVHVQLAAGPSYVPNAGGFQWLGGVSAGFGYRWAP